MRSVLAMALVLGLLVAVAPATVLADSVTYDFAGTLVTSFNGSNAVMGQFTLDNTGTGSVTEFHFSTPIGDVSSPSFSPSVVSFTAFSPSVNFVQLLFQDAANGTGLALLFQTDLSSFPGSGFYTGQVLPRPGAAVTFAAIDCPSCTNYFSFFTNGSSAAVPEPSSLLLFGSGLLGVVPLLRRRILPIFVWPMNSQASHT